MGTELARLAVEHDFTLLRTDYYLAPNEARNLAIHHVDTEFALFVDNDVFVPEGWVAGMETAADDHGAAAVAPVYGIASETLDRPRVHHAGGNNRVVEVDGVRVHDTTRYVTEDADPEVVLPGIVGRETEQVEFHCFLVSDPTWSERRFQLVRWSQGWTETSIRRFATTWDLDPEAFGASKLHRFTTAVRAKAYRPYRSVIGRLSVPRERLSRSIPDRTVGTLVYRREERRRALGAPVRVAHRATWDR